MPKERITSKIKNVILQGTYGFDVYIAMKTTDNPIKKFILEEGKPETQDGFKKRIRDSIVSTIEEKYLSEESQYAQVETIADDQHKYYVIAQDKEYYPFKYLGTPDEKIPSFTAEENADADGIFFKFTKYIDDQLSVLWAYQKIRPAAIPNKKKSYFQLRAKSGRPDIFEEMTDQMFMITKKIDLLILDNEIITQETSLIEKHFGFETFVRGRGMKIADKIENINLINNVGKIREYVERPNKRYAKKMMQISNFPIIDVKKEELLKRIQVVPRWRGKFEISENGITLRTFADVENLIDLFTERYTKSLIIDDQEYDTDVKTVV